MPEAYVPPFGLAGVLRRRRSASTRTGIARILREILPPLPEPLARDAPHTRRRQIVSVFPRFGLDQWERRTTLFDLPVNRCVGQDSNLGTPARTDLESVAVDQAWLPTHRDVRPDVPLNIPGSRVPASDIRRVPDRRWTGTASVSRDEVIGLTVGIGMAVAARDPHREPW